MCKKADACFLSCACRTTKRGTFVPGQQARGSENRACAVVPARVASLALILYLHILPDNVQLRAIQAPAAAPFMPLSNGTSFAQGVLTASAGAVGTRRAVAPPPGLHQIRWCFLLMRRLRRCPASEPLAAVLLWLWQGGAEPEHTHTFVVLSGQSILTSRFARKQSLVSDQIPSL